MRQAPRGAVIAAGAPVIIGVAGAGAGDQATRPFQLVTGRTWKGTAFGGVRGRRTGVPHASSGLVHGGQIQIDDLITHGCR